MFHLFWNLQKHECSTQRKQIKLEMIDKAVSTYTYANHLQGSKKGNTLEIVIHFDMFVSDVHYGAVCRKTRLLSRVAYIILNKIVAEWCVEKFPSSRLPSKSSIKQIGGHF